MIRPSFTNAFSLLVVHLAVLLRRVTTVRRISVRISQPENEVAHASALEAHAHITTNDSSEQSAFHFFDTAKENIASHARGGLGESRRVFPRMGAVHFVLETIQNTRALTLMTSQISCNHVQIIVSKTPVHARRVADGGR